MLNHFILFPLILCGLRGLQSSPVESNISNSLKAIRNAKSEEIRKYMNQSADPCENFFDFACGNWKTHHPADANVPLTSAIRMDISDFDPKVLQLLQTDDEMDSETDRKVKDFFQSCVNFQMNSSELREKVKELANEFGEMPALVGDKWQENDFDWLQTIAEINYKYDIRIIFGPYTVIYGRETDHTTYEIRISDAWRRGKFDLKTHQQKYKDSLIDYLDLESKVAEQTANEITDFYAMLREAGQNYSRADETKCSIQELQDKYSPDLDMKKLMNISFGFIPSGPVVDANPSFHQRLVEIMKKTPTKVVANYISFRLIEEFVTEAGKASETYACRLKTQTNFPKILGHMFYRTYKLEERQNNVEKMWQNIKLSLQMSLESSELSWFDDTSREYALEKLHSLKMIIMSYKDLDFNGKYGGFRVNRTDYFGNLRSLKTLKAIQFRQTLDESDESKHFMELTTRSYSTQSNAILIGIASLMSDYGFSDLHPSAINYGRLGFSISHELMHGFSGLGRLFNKLGDYRGKWEEGFEHEYAKRRKCLYAQYHNYTFGGRPLPQDAMQSENAADNGGIVLAYNAYRSWYEDSARTKAELAMEVLPNLNYNNNQLFFISYSQKWCADSLESIRSRIAAIDSHAPDQFRAFVPLINFDAFAGEFNCPRGSPMNPAKKCRMF